MGIFEKGMGLYRSGRLEAVVAAWMIRSTNAGKVLPGSSVRHAEPVGGGTEEMRFKATHDALTSLWDRGAILALLRSELSRSIREHLPVSLLLCDVDHFKQINDIHGHQAGDDVLQEVSTRLLDAVRSHDAVDAVAEKNS
jgi:GGDEF domain-containing protein